MSDEGRTYAIRLRRRAQQDMDAARERLAELTSESHADAWHNGLLDMLATLATYPHRHPLADEDEFFQDVVRVFSYRLSPRGVAYRVFYSIIDSDEDAPYIYVMHVRHGARRPMTRAEAREIDAEG
jgi:plasmid stabilization system protein ParE